MVELKDWTKSLQNPLSAGLLGLAFFSMLKTIESDKHVRGLSNVTILLVLISIGVMIDLRIKKLKKTKSKEYKNASIAFITVMGVLAVMVPGLYYGYRYYLAKEEDEHAEVEINHRNSAIYFWIVGAFAVLLNALTLDN